MAHAMDSRMSFLTPLFLARARRPRGAGAHPPDPARAEERRRVPVADVPAADPVPVGAAPPHPPLAAAAAAARGARADRRGVRAAVPAAAGAGGGGRRRRARSRRPARPVLQHGLRRSLDARDRRRAQGHRGRRRRRIARRSCSSRPAPKWRCDRRRTAAGSKRRSLTTKPGAGATRYGPALKLAGSILSESALPRREVDPDHRFPAQRLAGSRRCAAARRSGAHRRADQRCRHGERERDPGVDAALDLFRAGPGDGHRRRREPRRQAGCESGDRLELDGHPVQTEHINVEPNSSASITFTPFTPAAAGTRGTVRIGDRRAAARQRVQLCRRSETAGPSTDCRASCLDRVTRVSICPARSRSARPRRSRCRPSQSRGCRRTTCSVRRS